MSDSGRAMDAHAYVDGCLSPPERAAFEAAMARDGRLRVRADAWRAQNEAMQAAFGAAPRTRALTHRAASNENRPAERRGGAPGSGLRALTAALAGVALVMLWPSGGPNDPRGGLAARAEAALRSVSGPRAAALDVAVADPRSAAAWLRGRLPGLGEVALRAPGWTLTGVRLAPGAGDTAALVVFENAVGDRAGLWLERSDARPDWPARIERNADLVAVAGASGGLDYAVVGPRASGASALAPRRPGDQPPL